MVKRAGILLLMGCFFLSSCRAAPPASSSEVLSSSVSSASAEKAAPFTLSFNEDDTLSPFSAKTKENAELSTLLFEGLTRLDAAYVPQMSLASSLIAADPTHYVATLRPGMTFSDGSPITAADVSGSFDLAKTSAYYKVLLNNVEHAAVSKDGTVTFSLHAPDPNALACFSFPVIKISTATAAAGAAPLGSGAYLYRTNSLVANPHHLPAPSISTIYLKHLPSEDAKLHGLENGSISYYFTDLSAGEIPRTASASMDVPLPYLVFIGINASKGDLSQASVRRALSDALARDEISRSAFAGRAIPATLPFHNLWKPVADLSGFPPGETLSQALAQLEQAGYTGKGNSKNKKSLSLNLLMTEGNGFRNAAANLLVSQWAKAGVTVTISSVTFSQYKSRLSSGDFDLYMGEIRLTPDMSLRPLLTSGGAAAYGVPSGGSAAAAYQEYLSGQKSLPEFVAAFTADVPYIPLCWRKGIVSYNRWLTQVTPSAFDLFYGIENWKITG